MTNQTRNQALGDRVEEARSGWLRMRGLLGRKGLEPGEGLWIVPCRSVHTMFMRFAIDVLYLSRDHTVLKTLPALWPWNLTLAARGTCSVLELPAGTIHRTDTQVGDLLSFTAAAEAGPAFD